MSRRFMAEFHCLAAVPGGVAHLRQVLLQLAVRGALLPQDHSDEPVAALLSRIEARRAKLRSELGVRADAEGTDQRPEEDPEVHPLPSGWSWVRLGSLGVFVGGGTPSKGDSSLWGGAIPWVSPKDMKRPYIGDAQDTITERALTESAARLIPKGALLMVIRGMILAHSFPTALSTKPVTINQDMKGIVFGDPSIGEYVLRASWAARDDVLAKVERSSHGTCRLATAHVANLLIPLPPLEEQRRIVAKLDELLAVCDDLETRQAEQRASRERLNAGALDALLRANDAAEFETHWRRIYENFALFYDAPEAVERLRQAIVDLAVDGRFGVSGHDSETADSLLERIDSERRACWKERSPRQAYAPPCRPSDDAAQNRVPATWGLVTLDTLLAEPLCNGLSVKGQDVPPGVPALRLSAMNRPGLDYGEVRYLSIPEERAESLWVAEGDFFICRGNGSLGLVGRGVEASCPPTHVIFPDTMIRARFVPAARETGWLPLAWRSSSTRRQIESRAKTTAGIWKISQGQVQTIEIPLPPLAEQRRLVARVEQLMALCDALEARLREAHDLGAKLAAAVVRDLIGTMAEPAEVEANAVGQA